VNSSLYRSSTLEPDPFQVACFLLRNIATNHCFPDGNKRTAWWGTLFVLEEHAKVSVAASADDAYDFVIAVTCGNLTISEIVDWFAQRLCAPPD